MLQFRFCLSLTFKWWLKEKAAIVQGPAGTFWSMKCRLMKSWGQLNVRRSSLCLMQACVWPQSWSLSNSVSLSLQSPASCSLSDVGAIWSGSTSGDILLQSWDSSSLCAASLSAPRHLPWLKTLSHKKKKREAYLLCPLLNAACCVAFT